MRNKLLGEPTPRQSQIELSATTADMDNDQTDDQIMEQQTTTDNKPTNYDDIFQNTPAMHTRMAVSTRNRRDAKHEVIRKRPKRILLRNTITKRKCHSQISSSKLYTINYDCFLCIST
jgi:hypothetical protein